MLRRELASRFPMFLRLHQTKEVIPMSRTVYTPSTLPVQPRPDPLLLFIQQAQLILLYRERSFGEPRSW